MTRQNDKISESIQIASKNKLLLLFEMWCENINCSVLGYSVHGGDETNGVQKQCGTAAEGMVYST